MARRSLSTLVGGALAAVALLAGCSHLTDGKPTCPGCGTLAEPSFPTARPPASQPPVAAPPSAAPTPGPVPTATAAPVPGASPLPTNEQGYAYVETKSGLTRCQLSDEEVGCESQFANSPMLDGEHANGVSVTSTGDMRWILGNLGDIPVVTLDYRTYHAAGWTIVADSDGTRFTNDGTGHGMFVSTERVETF